MADDPTVNIDLDKLSNDALKERIELLKEKNKLEREAISGEQAAYEEASEQNEEVIKEIEKNIAALERKKRAGEELGAAQEAELERSKREVKMLREQNKSHASSVEAIKKHEAALEDLNDEGEKFTNILLGTNNQLGNFTKKLFGTKGGLKAFGKGLLGLLNPFKLLMSFITKVIQQSILFAVAVDKARASFVKATGASGKFEGEVVGLAHAMKGTGVRADEVAKAYGSLYAGMQDFTKISKSEREGLTKTVSLFQELGVSADTQAEILNDATRSLGYNATELEGVLLMVGGVADGLNEPINKVMENFKTVSSKLAFYGKNIEGVFKNLSAQSKATGLSMDELLGVAEQFDTFEGAGKAVGKLNAIMGGPYLNSIDMLNAKEDERVEILQRSMKQSGMNFKQMGKYEQKMIASSLGISPKEARKMFGAETESDKMEAMQAAKLAARQSRSQDIEEKMLSLMESFALNWSHHIEKVKSLIDYVGCQVRALLAWFEKLPGTTQVALTLGSLLGTYVISKFPSWLLRKVKAPRAGRPGQGPGGGAPGARGGRWWDPRMGKGGRWRQGGRLVKGGRAGFGARLMGGLRVATGMTGAGPMGARGGTRLGALGQMQMPKWIQNLSSMLNTKPAWVSKLNPANWRPQWITNITNWFKSPPQWIKVIKNVFGAGGAGAATAGEAAAVAESTSWLKGFKLMKVLGPLVAIIESVMLFFRWTERTEKASEGVYSETEALGRNLTDMFFTIVETVMAIAFFPEWLFMKIGTWLADILGMIPDVQGSLTDQFFEIFRNFDLEGQWLQFFKEYVSGFLMMWLPDKWSDKIIDTLGLDRMSKSGGGYSAGMSTEDAVAAAKERRARRERGETVTGMPYDDFIYRGKGELGPGTITPIHNKDQFFAAKPGGAINRVLETLKDISTATISAGTAGEEPIVINVHIGQRKIDQIVVDALNSPTGRRFLTGLND